VLGGDETRFVRVNDGVNSVAQPELVQGMPEMGFHRGLSDEKRVCDLGVRLSAGNEVEYFAVTRGEAVQRDGRPLWRERFRDERLDQFARGLLASELLLRALRGATLRLPSTSYYLTVATGTVVALGLVGATMPLLKRISAPENARND